MTTSEDKLIKELAIAIVENPRGTLKDIAEKAGTSKATLHRLYGTREDLEKALSQKAFACLDIIIAIALDESAEHRANFKQLISAHYEHKELLRCMTGSQSCADEAVWMPYMHAIDGFFLRGQKAGVFRIDVNHTILTEMFVSALCGMIDAERRGRIIPSQFVDSIENVFFQGILATATR